VNGWSKAGVGTSIVLAFSSSAKKKNPPTIALDLGATPAYIDSIRASCVLLTHGHMDHIGAIFSHARAHQLTFGGSSVPTYYVPLEILPLVEAAQKAMTAIDAAGRDDHSLLQMNLVGVTPGQEVVLPFRKLSGVELFVRPFRTTHAGCPSVGYILGTRWRRTELKAAYRGLPGEELRDLARSGVDLKDEVVSEELDVAYTGDTTIDALLTSLGNETATTISSSSDDDVKLENKQSQLYQCHTFLCECTFLDTESQDLARDRGHMHVNDVVRLLKLRVDESSSNMQRIILLHISGRYGASQALASLADAIPPHFHDRVDVAVMSLSGSEKYQELATGGASGEWTVSLLAYVQRKQQQVQEQETAPMTNQLDPVSTLRVDST